MPTYDYFSSFHQVASIEWRLPSNIVRLESPFTRQTQVIARMGERWECTITYPPRPTSDAYFYQAIGTHLWVRDDGVNPVASEWMIPFLGYAGPQGGAAGSASLTATGTSGSRLLTIDGLTSQPDPVFVGGDAIQVGDHLYLVAASHVNRGSGSSAVVPVWPRLRANYSSAAVSLTNPRVKMRRVSPLSWRTEPGNIAYIDPVDFVEVYP